MSEQPGPRSDPRVRAALAREPTRVLIQRPTPLHRLDHLSTRLGREVWIKRDDLASVALGGNKVRKLEYLLGAAQAEGHDVVITVGAEQSNHARCTAVVSAMLGLDCHLVLGGTEPATPEGNIALDRLAGAELHWCPTDDWVALHDAATQLAAELTASGRRPYLLPIGGSTAIGALGFVDAYLELRAQLTAVGLMPGAVVHATSSGGTQAGLIAGRQLCGDDVRIIGVGVVKLAGDLAATIAHLTGSVLRRLGHDAAPDAPTVLDGYVGDAYAVPSVGGTDAALALLRTEGILLDPVYTAKAFHAVMDTDLGEGRPVVFWHTGGTPSVFTAENLGHLLDAP